MGAVPFRKDGKWHLWGRGFTLDPSQPVTRSCIFQATGENLFEFGVDAAPLLVPGSAGDADRLACEDPTRIESPAYGSGLLYSQVRRIPSATMVARGKSAEDLAVFVSLGCIFPEKSPAIHTVLEPTEQHWWRSGLDMCKEAEVMIRKAEDHDVLFYEFADSESSRIAVAKVDFCGRNPNPLSCRASDSRLWLDKRPGKWDSDHVSTGPIVDFGSKKLMFYNGRDSQTWAIGEVVFDPHTLEIEYRSEEPIILPPKEIGWADQYIAFSSGAEAVDGKIYLYHHIADKRIRCAVGSF